MTQVKKFIKSPYEQKWGEHVKIQEAMQAEDYFYSADLEILAKHFLSRFCNFNIFQEPFDMIYQEFSKLVDSRKEKKMHAQVIKEGESPKDIEVEPEVPSSPKEFYHYICDYFLHLEIAPKEKLLARYSKCSKHLKEIEVNIQSYSEKVRELESKREKETFQEEDNANLYRYKYFIEKNKDAKKQINSFMAHGIKEHALGESHRKLFNFGFFRNSPYSFDHDPEKFNAERISEFINKLGKLPWSQAESVQNLFETDKKEYFNFLKGYIDEFNIKEEIRSLIQDNHLLHKRAEIFEEILDSFENEKLLIFCSVVPPQIEGMFHDYCDALGGRPKNIALSSFSEKLKILNSEEEIFFDYEYFYFKFQIIRNKVAHGKLYSSKSEDIGGLSSSLLLDLFDVCDKLCSNSIPSNRVTFAARKFLEKNDEYKLLSYFVCVEVDVCKAPEFYRIDHEQLLGAASKEKFFDFLSKKIDEENSENRPDSLLLWGIKQTVIHLKKERVNPEVCEKLLVKIGEISQKAKFSSQEIVEQFIG